MTPEDNQPELPSSSKKKKTRSSRASKKPHRQIKRGETRLVGGSPGIPGLEQRHLSSPGEENQAPADKKAALLPKAGEGVKVTEKGGGT